jgi:thiol:disulfide interchange protein
MKYLLPAVVIAGIAIAGCGAPAGDNAPAEPHSGWIENDLEAASAAAEEEGKPLLIDLYADWCGPCRTLSEQYFPSDELQPVLEHFVLVKIDIDSESGGPVADRYGVSSIPTVIIAEADGTEIQRIVGITPTTAEYAAELQDIVDSL